MAWTRTQVIEWMEKEDLTYSVVVQSTGLRGGLGGVGGGCGQDTPAYTLFVQCTSVLLRPSDWSAQRTGFMC